ncbi:hypothetical protein BUALT_Bualt05G0145900 [Buddleja alternifolia]|uniref:Uncharacterized protein n=1 Tax=Buddleja alternifolia TaxID=168488 RepID=A0AAV6XUY6_9LAMI|nr:hypothetical protein BUALT_Bualt05G0145900 [Buddleja alternifolia]
MQQRFFLKSVQAVSSAPFFSGRILNPNLHPPATTGTPPTNPDARHNAASAAARNHQSSEQVTFNQADMDSARQEKVRKFEEFVDLRLKPDLVHAIAERSDLRRNIENLEKNSVTSLRTLVNLGSEVYMQADVPDTRHIFVDVGLGFHVEFTWSEALNFIAAKEEKLSRQIEEYTRLIGSIKAQIKMVCEGIREILQLPVTDL